MDSGNLGSSQAAPIENQTSNELNDNSNTQGSSDLSNYILRSEAARIVSDKRREGIQKGYEDGRKSALEEYQRNQSAQSSHGQQPVHQQQPQSNIGVSEDEVNRRIDERLNQRLQEQNARSESDRVVSDFVNKVAGASHEYPDFEKSFQSLHLDGYKPEAQAFIIKAATSVDNTADLIMAWSQNPSRMQDIVNTAVFNPSLAQAELTRYAASLRANKEAQNNSPNVRQPLSKLTASNTGLDSGELSVDDLMNMPEYRR